jgi:uncharacterized damage-inducible protein DinB
MTIQEALELFAYNAWANGRVFDAAEALTADQVGATASSSFPSVRGTLGHLVSGEWVWLRRWQGESPSVIPEWADGSSLAELRSRLAAVQAERDGYFASMKDTDLARVVEYRNIAGEAHAEPLAGLVRHVVNHSTYHRGQVATQLRQLGVTPPGTDLVVFLRQRR